jgi:predicted nuclease with TOPRIM domain
VNNSISLDVWTQCGKLKNKWRKGKMKRYEPYETSIINDVNGTYIKYEDYLQEVEIIELEIRYLGEEIEILKDEVQYWKDMYNELYEQTS